MPAPSPTSTTIRSAVHAMGTRFEFVLHSENESESETNLRAISDEIIDEITRLDHQLSFFRNDSLLSHINRTAAAHPVRLDPEIFNLFRNALQVHRDSQGAFDITIAPLMRKFGFRNSPDKIETNSEIVVGSQHIILNKKNHTIAFANPGLAIDLGGIAKGFALDQAARILDQANITCALIHGGTSTVIGIGAPPNHPTGWRIAIADHSQHKSPTVAADDDNQLAQTPLTADLKNHTALSVSAPHGRTITNNPNDEPVSHILDPRNIINSSVAAPAANQPPFAAVLTSESAALADAWSTALLVLANRPPNLPESITTILPNESANADCTIYTVQGHLRTTVLQTT